MVVVEVYLHGKKVNEVVRVDTIVGPHYYSSWPTMVRYEWDFIEDLLKSYARNGAKFVHLGKEIPLEKVLEVL